MNWRWCGSVIIGGILFLAVSCHQVEAQIAAARETGEVVLKSLSKFFGKSSTSELSQALADYGGEAAVRQLAQKAVVEGGELAVQQIAVAAGKFGPETIRALQNVDQIGPVLRSLNELPESTAKSALQRLAAANTGRELSQNIALYGTRALRSELTHPGIGTQLVRALGNDGIELAERLSRDQAITLSKHADDIAKLPVAEKNSVLKLLHQDAQAMVAFFGRFIERNPTKTLFATGTTAVVLAESDRILGGDEIVFDVNGIPHVVSKPGLSGRIVEAASKSVVNPLMSFLVPIFALAAVIWLSIKLWFSFRDAD